MRQKKDRRGAAFLWHLAGRELRARRLSSALSLAVIFFAMSLVLTIALYLTGTQIAQDAVLSNMQHVLYMEVSQEQLTALAADEKTEMCIPYKPCGTEFETDGVRFDLIYYESTAEGIRTYTVAEGRLPERYDEVVVDRAFMAALGRESVLDTEITLDLNGRPEHFTVCGYTDDGYTYLTHPVRVSREFADSSPEMSGLPYTAALRLKDAGDMPLSTFTTAVYQLAMDYGIPRANVNINGAFETSLQSGGTAGYVIVLLSAVIAAACGVVIYSIFYLSVTSSTQRLGQYLTLGMTRRQMRRLIRTEGFLLSALAIPAALIFSSFLAYCILPDGWSLKNCCLLGLAASCFTLLVVQLSVGKPAALAAKVSPIEAARGTAADCDRVAKRPRPRRLPTPFQLARITAETDWKKWLFTTLSLAFSGILFMTAATWMASWEDEAYSRQNGFQNNEYHISYLYDHTYPAPYGLTEMQLKGHLSSGLLSEIRSIPHVQSVWTEPEVYGNITLQGATFLQSFYPLTPEDTAYFTLEAEGNNTYAYMAENDAILITNAAFSEQANGVTFTPGDTITFSYFDGEEHTIELEIAAVSDAYVSDGIGRPTFCMAKETMEKLWGDMNTTAAIYVSVENYAENGDTVEAALRSLVDGYSDLSLWTLREQKIQDSSMIARQKLQIYGISIFLILFSVFNLVNTVISSFAVRKRELAMMASIGMQRRQLRAMLSYENILQMLPNLLLTFTLGTLAGAVLICTLQRSAGYLHYSFPVFVAAAYALCLLVLPLLITAACLRAQERTALTERIRGVD